MKDLDLDYWTIFRLLLSVREIESRGVGTNVGQDMKLKRKLGTSLKCCIVFYIFQRCLIWDMLVQFDHSGLPSCHPEGTTPKVYLHT